MVICKIMHDVGKADRDKKTFTISPTLEHGEVNHQRKSIGS